MAILITFLAGISILIGAVIIKTVKNPHTIEQISIALALGSLLSLMLFDLLPDLLHSGEELPFFLTIIFTLLGVGLLRILDFFIPEHEDTEENHDDENAAHIGLISAIAVILHNIIEGMTVYSLSLSSQSQGVIFAIGIALHNIPMGMLIDSTLEGHKKSARYGILSAVTLSTLFGGILMTVISSVLTEAVITALVAIALGMIIYIVFFELLPHVLKTRPLPPSLIASVVGFLLVLGSSILG